MSGRDPNDQIEELKKQLAKAEDKIEELEQLVQAGAENIKELLDEKKSLGNEVSELKQKIKRLEEEREAKERGFKDLLDRMEKMEKKSREQDEMKKESIYRMDKMEKELKFCREEISYFSNKCKDQESNLKVYMAKTDSLEKSRNMLFIGQLCAKLMERVYRDVLPDYFQRSDYKQPHLEAIDAKIEELCQTRKGKIEAREKWSKWQAEIDEDLIKFMEEKLKRRNEEAHPFPLIEWELKEMAKSLPGQEQHQLEKVIQIGQRLSEFSS